MASRKSFLSRSAYVFPETSEVRFEPKSSEGVLEFEEADIWNVSNDVSESKKVGSGPRSGLKMKMPSRKVEGGGKVNTGTGGSASLPVNIPDWSKILKEEYKGHSVKERDHHDDFDDDDDDDEDEEMKIPPHEYLARTRMASMSVHEGIGRTLKGRDLRSVRNAIWKKVGFED